MLPELDTWWLRELLGVEGTDYCTGVEIGVFRVARTEGEAGFLKT